MKMVKVLQPNYYDDFACIGSDCKYNCCQGWNIDLSLGEVRKTRRRIKSPGVEAIFKGACVPIEENKDSSPGGVQRYRIKLNKDGACPMLDSNGLCWIYKECGPDVMSRTCRIYPRKQVKVLDRYEEWLSPSCEEVVRLLLREKDGIKLKTVEVDYDTSTLWEGSQLKPELFMKRPIMKQYYPLKALFVELLQNRKYTMGERMVLLGIAMRGLDGLEREEKYDSIPYYVQLFIKDLPSKEEEYRAFFETARANKGFHRGANMISTFTAFLGARKGTPMYGIREKVFQNLGIVNFEEEWKNPDKVFEKMIETPERTAIFEKIMAGREHILENLMIAIGLYLNFPFQEEVSIWENYCNFADLYSIYVFILMYYLDEDSTDEDLIYCITVISRSTVHNATLLKAITKRLQDRKDTRLEYMALLVL